MRIGVDGSMLTGFKYGIGQYVAAMLKSMAEIVPKEEFILYTYGPLDHFQKHNNIKINIVAPFAGRLWLQVKLPKHLVADKIDLFWGGNYALPFYPSRIKKVSTVHDFVYKNYPKTLPLRTVQHLNLAMPLYLGAADHVLVDSENTAYDLYKFYNFPQEKKTVVPLAVRSDYFTEKTSEAIEAVLNKFNLQVGYLLFVGTVEPRKGLNTILEALYTFRQRKGFCPRLVVVGKIGWKTGSITRALKQFSLEDSVSFLNYVTDADLPVLYQGASLFVYPSLYEGFGLPVLEAMASGLPVITSNSSSLPEVGGDAVLYIEPGNASELASLIEKVLADKVLQADLKARGRVRAKHFSWQKAAKQTLTVFEKVMKGF